MAAFEALGIADEWSYEAIDVALEEFPERVGALASARFVGANVTVPHKHAALALADTASDPAGEIGSANMLSFQRGAIAADNTDAPGFLAALPSSPSRLRALVLGAGGSARAVVWALVREGAEVEVWNRTAERAAALAEALGASALGADDPLPSSDFDLIVNATSVGLEGGGRESASASSDLDALRLAPEGLRGGQIVVDLVYGSTETELVRAARERGATVVDGLEVLVQQGAASFRIWTGLDAPLDVMREAAKA
jgi:shikimate dehydrogenase